MLPLFPRPTGRAGHEKEVAPMTERVRTSSEVAWEHSLDAARDRARAESKPVLLDFWHDG